MGGEAKWLGGDMTDRMIIEIKIHLSGIGGRIQRGVAKTTQLLAVGLKADAAAAAEGGPLPGAELDIHFRVAPITPDEAKERWHAWLFTNAFRDIAELVHGMIDEIRWVLAAWAMKAYLNPDGSINGSVWSDFARGNEKFHRLTLPDKFDALARDFNFAIPDAVKERLLSINAARNCLVHREGFVHARDTSAGIALNLRWTATRIFIEFDDGVEEEIAFDVPLRAAGMLCLRTGVPSEKVFGIGERISVSARQFVQIGWSIYVDAVTIAKLVEERGIAEGHMPQLAAA